MTNTLKCSTCGLDKPDEEFPRNRRATNRRGRFHNCRDCTKTYYLANKDRHRASTRAVHIRKRYGMSVEEYERIIAQGCAICEDKASTRMVMDHCHTSGRVRDALCTNCNVVLGSAHDDPSILRAAADYLERHAAA